jgi:hypothetical protein
VITGSPSRLERGDPPGLDRERRPKGVFPRFGGARRPGPHRRVREQAAGETASSNYWSATSNANNPNNAWNVNFNNGNVNNNNKNNDNHVRAVRSSP